MKKNIFLFLIFFIVYIFAVDKNNITKSVYHTIFLELYPKKNIFLYIKNHKYINYFEDIPNLKITSDITTADIAFITSKKELEDLIKTGTDIAIFTTKESLLYSSKSVIGAFYWMKGRRQLFFIKKRLDRYHLSLPPHYIKFVLDEL